MSSDLQRPRRKLYEHALNVVKAALNGVPAPFAGSIASLIEDYVPKSTENAVWHAMEFLNKKLEHLHERCDLKQDPDELSDTFKSFIVIAQRSTRQEKLQAAAGLFANALLKNGDNQKLSYTEIDHFGRAIESLSAGAISALGTVCRVARSGSRRQSSFGTYRLNAVEIMPQLSPIRPDVAISLLCELSGWNLLNVQQTGFVTTGDEYPMNMPVTLTTMGMRLVDYVVGLGESNTTVGGTMRPRN